MCEPLDRTHADSRVNESDAVYVPIAAIETMLVEARRLGAEMEADLARLKANIATAPVVSIHGVLHRVLPEPLGYIGTAGTVEAVETGRLVVKPFGLR